MAAVAVVKKICAIKKKISKIYIFLNMINLLGTVALNN